MNASQPATALLWVGSHQELVQKTYRWLQLLFGTCQACRLCTTCRLLEEQQYYAVTWLSPQNTYVLEDLQSLFDTVSFKLEQGKHHVFVIQHADALTDICANRLLKTVEEPPQGYHFIFLAERLDALQPTLVSRCMVQVFPQGTQLSLANSLRSFFITTDTQSPVAFLQELDKVKPTEQATSLALDEIFTYWLRQVSEACVNRDTKKKERALRIIAKVHPYITGPLMPGSSKIVWKDLFLQVKYG